MTADEPLHEYVDLSEIDRLRIQVLHLRDQQIGAEAKLGELRARMERLQDRSSRIERLNELHVANSENELALGRMYARRVEEMESSTTWKIGRAIVNPIFAIRRMLGRR